MLIRLRECAGWSAPLLFACNSLGFSRRGRIDQHYDSVCMKLQHYQIFINFEQDKKLNLDLMDSYYKNICFGTNDKIETNVTVIDMTSNRA